MIDKHDWRGGQQVVTKCLPEFEWGLLGRLVGLAKPAHPPAVVAAKLIQTLDESKGGKMIHSARGLFFVSNSEWMLNIPVTTRAYYCVQRRNRQGKNACDAQLVGDFIFNRHFWWKTFTADRMTSGENSHGRMWGTKLPFYMLRRIFYFRNSQLIISVSSCWGEKFRLKGNPSWLGLGGRGLRGLMDHN